MSSIPSSAMPHAKPHEHEEGAVRQTDDGSLKDKAANFANRTKEQAREHPKTGIAIGAAVAAALGCLAALPFFLSSRKDRKEPIDRRSAD